MVGLERRIKDIYDHLYANAAVRTPSALATEVVKVLRTVAYVERERGDQRPAFELGERGRRELAAGGPPVRRLAAQVRAAFADMNKAWQLYGPGEGLQLGDADLAWCCAVLDGLAVADGAGDVFGDAVEIFRTSWAKRSSGQFFTDARVARLAMALLDLDPRRGDDLVDICCGTGGFLLAGLDWIRATVGDERKAARLALGALRGQEIDPEIHEVAAASLVSRLGTAAAALVTRGDSLAPGAFKSGGPIREGSHRCAVANPPFGTRITVKDHSVLADYQVASLWRPGGGTRATSPDLLLLEKNVRLLEPGHGRLAIVLPFQILSGPQSRPVREWLLKQMHVEAVVDLPPETFQPHTGTKTSLVLLRRRVRPAVRVPTNEGGEVFLATPRWVGHDRRGQPLWAPGPDGCKQGKVISDLEDVARAFRRFHEGGAPGEVHPLSFAMARSQLAADPDLRLDARYHRELVEPGIGRRRQAVGPATWRCVRVGDLCERIFFPKRFKRRYVARGEGAIPFLGGANIGQLVPRVEKWLAPDDPALGELRVEPGWILVTRSGTTGVVSSVPAAWDGVAMSEHVIRLVPKPDAEIDPVWLQVVLRSELGQRALARGVFGSVIDEITPQFIAGLEIPVPSDRRVLEDIVSQARDAEAARQRSVAAWTSAVRMFEETVQARG